MIEEPIPLKCPSCGAPMAPHTRRCEYCGTWFVFDDEDDYEEEEEYYVIGRKEPVTLSNWPYQTLSFLTPMCVSMSCPPEYYKNRTKQSGYVEK